MSTPETLRKALEFIATHDSSDWPERCRKNVKMARAALAQPQPATVKDSLTVEQAFILQGAQPQPQPQQAAPETTQQMVSRALADFRTAKGNARGDEYEGMRYAIQQARAAHLQELYKAGMLAAPAGQAAAPEEKPTRADLLAALKWYADGEHFTKADPDAWDTVSGEPQNWWCDEAGTATIEDGTLAGMVLAGKLTGAQLTALEDGEVIPEQAPTAPASTPQAAERGG